MRCSREAAKIPAIMRLMRLALAFMLMASAFYGADLRIDHVTLAGQSLDSMREAFTAATGIRTEYGGSHANHVTEMAIASFPDGSYIELMGIQGGADPPLWRHTRGADFFVMTADRAPSRCACPT
jgi:hypothetical protein